ncbi:hypothetical protein GE09DRAFT_287050 [Coniochaeta sp. 2T2.1]|nr:hypothetical protein GE09DRAFT_287050 [Coniochaeta sp. 2T2.1]
MAEQTKARLVVLEDKLRDNCRQIFKATAEDLQTKEQQYRQSSQRRLHAALRAAVVASSPDLKAVDGEHAALKEEEKRVAEYLSKVLPTEQFHCLWTTKREQDQQSIRTSESNHDRKIKQCLSSLYDLYEAGPEAAEPTPDRSPVNDTDVDGVQPDRVRDALATTQPNIFVASDAYVDDVTRTNKRTATSTADAAGVLAETASNKRARTYNSDYSFRASVEEDSEEKSAQSPLCPRFRGTAYAYQVEGIHWAFKHPATGHGYYILACDEKHLDTDEPPHAFFMDPWVLNRCGAIKHYAAQTSRACHGNPFPNALAVTESMIMERFGYRVEGYTEEDCLRGNSRLEVKQHGKTQAQKQKNAKPKTGKKTPMSPHVHTIRRNPQVGPAPPADMGQTGNGIGNGYNDAIPTVTSDLCG